MTRKTKSDISKRKSMRESEIERYFIKRVKSIGGETRKIKWIGRSHAPDRLVIFEGVRFVELKRPGKSPRAGQLREHARLLKRGVRVFVISTIQEVDEFINEIVSHI